MKYKFSLLGKEKEGKMNVHGSSIKLFAGSASRTLSNKIAKHLFMELGEIELGKFSDGETNISIGETVRGRDVFMIQSTSTPTNDNLMELLISIDALKRASAGRITAVIPYFGYARQDRKAKARDPITAKLVANLIETAGADRVLTMDLHAAQIQGFFDIPVDHLLGSPVITKYFQEKFSKNIKDENSDIVVVSPDVGSVTRSRKLAERLGVPLAIIDKRRPRANVMEVMNIIGDVKEKICIMIDDMIDTAGTICQGAEALRENGAKEVYACCTHPVLSGQAIERIEKSPIKELVVLDTYPHPKEKMTKKITTISIAPIFADAIKGYMKINQFQNCTNKIKEKGKEILSLFKFHGR